MLNTEVELRKQRNQHFGDVAQGKVGLEKGGRGVVEGLAGERKGETGGGGGGGGAKGGGNGAKGGERKKKKAKVRKERE